MNIALAFHSGDRDQAERWLAWCAELGGVSNHNLFLMPAKGVTVPGEGKQSPFKSVTVVRDEMGITSNWSAGNQAVRCASGANSMFRQFARYFNGRKLGPWMFMEPDAIPLCPEWADRLEAEYLACGKRYMGGLVQVVNVPVHGTGVAIYPENAAHSEWLMMPKSATFGTDEVEVAFDVAGAKDVLASHHNTQLIQHVFRGPSFTSQEQFERDVRSDAVLFHTCKDGSILPFLRQKLSGVDKSGLSRRAHNPENAGSNPAPATAPARNIVYTYYQKCAGMDEQEQEWMLARWAQAWAREGWTTIVLNEEDCKSHPKYEFLKKAFSELPTVNPPEYELACYMRWVAMVQRGGGLCVDYDVLPYGFSADVHEIQCEARAINHEYPLMLADKNPCPCAMVGTAEQYNKAAFAFAFDGKDCVTTERGMPHVSDQQLVQMWRFPAVDICFQYGREGWQSAKLVHYSHGGCGGRKRSDVIPVAEKMHVGITTSEPSPPVRPEGWGEVRLMPCSSSASLADQIRHHANALKTLVDDKPSRKKVVHTALRDAGLLGAPKKRGKK